MTVFVLATGALFRAPEQKVSKLGKSFAAATMLAEGGFWNVVAFDENAQSELMRLGACDSLTVQGRLKVETYTKDGEKRTSLGVVAEHVLALRQVKKPQGGQP